MWHLSRHHCFRKHDKSHNSRENTLVSSRYPETCWLFDIGCPSETHLKLTSCEISFVRKAPFSYPKVLYKVWQNQCRALCKMSKQLGKFEKVMDKRNFARCEFKTSFGRISYIAHQLAGNMISKLWACNATSQPLHWGSEIFGAKSSHHGRWCLEIYLYIYRKKSMRRE